MKRAIIVGSGKAPKFNIKDIFSDGDLIIAVDGGYDYLKNAKIRVDFLIGDFDSIDYDIDKIKDTKLLKYPTNKSATDMEIAIDFAIEKKAEEILIFGATGSRIDHSLANILLLLKINEHKIKGRIIDNNNDIRVIDRSITIEKSNYKYLSLLVLEKNTLVSISGVKYPLEDKLLDYPTSLTISNEITDNLCTIDTNKRLILIQSND